MDGVIENNTGVRSVRVSLQPAPKRVLPAKPKVDYSYLTRFTGLKVNKDSVLV